MSQACGSFFISEPAEERLILGSDALEIARATYEQRLQTWEQWNEVSRAAQGN